MPRGKHTITDHMLQEKCEEVNMDCGTVFEIDDRGNGFRINGRVWGTRKDCFVWLKGFQAGYSNIARNY